MSKDFLKTIFGNVSGEKTQQHVTLLPLAEKFADRFVFAAKSMNQLTLKSFGAKDALKEQLAAMQSALNGGQYEGEAGKRELETKIAEILTIMAGTDAMINASGDQVYVDELAEIEKILVSLFNGSQSVGATFLMALMYVAQQRDPISGRKVIELLRQDKQFQVIFDQFRRS